MAVAMPGQQEAPEVQVRRQRRDHPALWCPPFSPARLGGLHRVPVDDLHHGDCEPALDDAEEASIGDAAGQTTHQGRVRDRGEVVAQIRVHHLPPPMLRHVPVDPAESHLGVQSGAKAILLWQQVRLEDGPDDQHHRHLDHAVADGGDAERPPASVALWYPHPQEGLRSVAPRDQLLPQPFQPPLHARGLDPGKALAVHPRRPRVAAAATVGFLQDVLATDLVPERVEAEGGFSLSFRL
jgi:hypothetical protein